VRVVSSCTRRAGTGSTGSPSGQPILEGHHSENRDRRYRDRAASKIEAGLAEMDRADRLAARAEAVQGHQEHRHDPRVVMRRIERLEAQRRAAARAGRDTTDYDTDIAHWRGVLANHAEHSTFVAWTRDDFIKGRLRPGPRRRLVPGQARQRQDGQRRDHRASHRSVRPDHRAAARPGATRHPHGEPWPVELARKVTRWRRLQHVLSLSSSQSYDEKSLNRRRHAAWAKRLALGLPVTVAEAEVAAFTAPDRDTDRRLAAARIEIYDQILGGERPADIAATVTPIDCGEPAWRMPAGEPEDRRVDQLKPGDIIAGYWGRAFGGRRLATSFAGPVKHVTAVVDRHERGRWVTVELVDGSTQHHQTHVWFSVFPAAFPT
jgi:hypothetical protein